MTYPISEWQQTELMDSLGLMESPPAFGGDQAVQDWAANLATEWGARLSRDPAEQQRHMQTKLSWLVSDYELTLAGAQRRFGARFNLTNTIRAWQVGRQQQMEFETRDRTPRLPRTFGPPADTIHLVSDPIVGNSERNPVAPLVIAFMQQLRQLYPQVRADTYSNHGGGAFQGRGFSVDLWLDNSRRDVRGFWVPEDAIALLRAIHRAAVLVGAEWRVLYNDYSVAQVINQETGQSHVRFVGGNSSSGNLNWHGPAPLILHFHLDLAPLPSAAAATSQHTSSSARSESYTPRTTSYGEGLAERTDPYEASECGCGCQSNYQSGTLSRFGEATLEEQAVAPAFRFFCASGCAPHTADQCMPLVFQSIRSAIQLAENAADKLEARDPEALRLFRFFFGDPLRPVPWADGRLAADLVAHRFRQAAHGFQTRVPHIRCSTSADCNAFVDPLSPPSPANPLPRNTIFVCPPFWNTSAPGTEPRIWRAAVLLHEMLHLLYLFAHQTTPPLPIDPHEHRRDNSHCYEAFALRVAGYGADHVDVSACRARPF